MELRETIEALRTKNEEAQAVIHVALNNPENPKGLLLSQDICAIHPPLSLLIFAPFDISLSRQTCGSDGRTPARASPASTV